MKTKQAFQFVVFVLLLSSSAAFGVAHKLPKFWLPSPDGQDHPQVPRCQQMLAVQVEAMARLEDIIRDFPLETRNAAFENFNSEDDIDRAALSAAHQLVDTYDRSAGLFLWGDVGRGKSHLAASIARASTLLGERVDFVTPQNAIQYWDFNRNEPRADLLEDDVIILDDFNAPELVKARSNEVYDFNVTFKYIYRALVMRAFTEAHYKLVVTSNQSLETLTTWLFSRKTIQWEHFNDRARSLFYQIHMTGKSRRQSGAWAGVRPPEISEE
jgi:DNA replication protein DnaC